MSEDHWPSYEQGKEIHMLKMAEEGAGKRLRLQWLWSEAVYLRTTYNSKIYKTKEEEEENKRDICNEGCSVVFFSLVFTLSLRKDVIIG